jgi:hypothetical protein
MGHPLRSLFRTPSPLYTLGQSDYSDYISVVAAARAQYSY